MLSVFLGPTSFLPATPPLAAPSLLRAVPAVQRSAPDAVRLQLQREQFESAKVCGISAFFGSLASVPIFSADSSISSSVDWEFAIGMLAPELALFGAIYRCTVRCDDNNALRQGAIGGFALFRAFAMMDFPNSAADLWPQLMISFGEGVFIFGCASQAIEWAWSRGFGRPL
jgi:hypothetical protein